ncbi:MAG: beta-lactamase family protein [Bacteroidales bacterium]|nr:beta-lactamase family protein [Clostridium sp.]MCM1204222.1 beta-lactamase family protein [Bacteroidales bacterium]
MKKLYRLFLSLLFIFILIFCNSPCSALAASGVLPSGIAYDELAQQIDAYVEEHRETTAGMETAVFTKDSILFHKEYGYINKEEKLELSPDSILDWGSISKTLIWVSAMQLWEAGLLDLDADIRQYLPDGYLTNLSHDTPVTMLDLMNHQGGFQESYADMYVSDTKNVHPLGEQLLKHQPAQVYEPGTVTSYSNWGSALAAYVIEQISRQSYDDYVREHIFTPLGMNNTAIRPDLSDQKGVLERRLETKCYTASGTRLPRSFYHIPLYPCGMCAGTLDDLILYAQALMPADGQASPLFQKTDTLQLLLSPSSFLGDSEYARFCHGFPVKYYSVPVITHGGNSYGCSAIMAIDTDSGIGTVVMTNQYTESIYTEDMLPLIYGSPASADSIPVPQSTEQQYVTQTRTFLEGPLSILSAFGTGYTRPDNDIPWSYSSNDGVAKFQFTEAVDWVVISPQRYYASTILVLLFLISLFYLIIIRGVGGGIALCLRKLQRKTVSASDILLIRRERTACILMGLWYVNLGIIIYRLYSNAPCYTYQWQFALTGILGILMIVTFFSLLMHRKSGSLKFSQKLKLVFTGFFLLVSVAAIFYWDMYQFWAL